jgi:hypothetical protein
MKSLTTLFLALSFLLFSCSKFKKTYKNVDVEMTPMGFYGINCTKFYSAMFTYNSETYMVENIEDKYKNSLTSLPVTIDFKIIKKIKCDTDGQFNAELYEVKVLAIKDR